MKLDLDRVRPDNTALIVVDMVKDFTDPEGLVFYPMNREILPGIGEAVDFCHDHNVLVIFMQHCYRKGKPERNLETMRPNCIEGSGGEEIDPLLHVDEEKDYVIKKRRYSAFYGTDLDLVLREHDIKNTIIVGTKTNCCIRATVQDAYFHDYRPIVLKDLVGTNSVEVNEMHLTEIDKYFGTVMAADEFYRVIEKNVMEENIIEEGVIKENVIKENVIEEDVIKENGIKKKG